MKSIFAFLLFCFIMISCNTEDAPEGVQVKFYNETGFKIEELNIGNKNIGSLDINENTDFIIYDQFGFDSGLPDENCNGIIAGSSVESYNGFYWCGTEKVIVEDGVYEMSIDLIEFETDFYFRIAIK